jgi:hypothetical protein
MKGMLPVERRASARKLAAAATLYLDEDHTRCGIKHIGMVRYLSPANGHYRLSCGLSTLVFIVFPDALTQGFIGDDPDMKFCQCILGYTIVTSYAVVAVVVFDAVGDRVRAWRGSD